MVGKHGAKNAAQLDQLMPVFVRPRQPTQLNAKNDPTMVESDLGKQRPNGTFEHVESKDIPCNDLIMFKLRDGKLDITVCCRSNDAIWGAYGANAVQFSVLQEFVACALHVDVGVYRQISDSFHIYTSNPAWQRLTHTVPKYMDSYRMHHVKPYPLVDPLIYAHRTPDFWKEWLYQLRHFTEGTLRNLYTLPDPFFTFVALPIQDAWNIYKDATESGSVERAIALLEKNCRATDWKLACVQWLQRRKIR